MSWKKDDFLLRGPDDFVRLDGLCAQLLGDFFAWLQTADGGSFQSEAASALGHAADRYVRDFVVDILESGPADPDPTLPRRYVGNWYIVNTLAPSHQEIDRILLALGRLYEYLRVQELISDSTAKDVARDLSEGAYFHRRLDDFWDLTPEGIGPWRSIDEVRRRPPSASVH